jgi:uncharacterized protein
VRPPRCPTCKKAAAPRGENPSFPFCSPRCKLVDLGRWLGEDYRVPGESAGDGGPGRESDAEEP